MNQNVIFYPCFGMMLLSGVVLLRMFFTRVGAVKKGTVDIRHFKTYDMQEKCPPLMIQAARNFTNLFEVPTLFYMVCAFALITKNVDSIFYTAAWIYFGLRCLHSFIHTTSNKIGVRMSLYTLSWITLMFMGVLLFIRIQQSL